MKETNLDKIEQAIEILMKKEGYVWCEDSYKVSYPCWIKDANNKKQK